MDSNQPKIPYQLLKHLDQLNALLIALHNHEIAEEIGQPLDRLTLLEMTIKKANSIERDVTRLVGDCENCKNNKLGATLRGEEPLQ